MAVAHSAASESHTGTTGSANQAAFSWTHTQTGTPQGVVVFVSTYASVADLITSVTYGGVALTRLTGGSAQDAAGELGRLDAFFLGSGLGTGNQTITVNRTNNATVMYASAATVTAGADTAVPTATIVLLQGDGTLTVQSVDDTSPGQDSVRYAGTYSGLNAPPTAGTGSTLLNSIDIGNYGSALVRETTAGQGARNVGFSGTTDDRAAVHLAIRELVPRTETPIVGTFTLTGNDATLTKASPKELSAEVGTFTFTGNPATLSHDIQVTGERGQFTFTGNNVVLERGLNLSGEVGTFSLVGNPATFAVGYEITAEVGGFTFTGNNVTFSRTRIARAEVGAFIFTGKPAALTTTNAIEIDPIVGTFNLTGNNVTFKYDVKLAVELGTFTFTGNSATLTKVTNRSLTADKGTFALTGNQVIPSRTYNLSAEKETFVLTGNPISFLKGIGFAAEAGSFVLSGKTIAFARTYQSAAGSGSFTLTGLNATLAKPGSGRRRNVLIF